jgi:hypothetical protein
VVDSTGRPSIACQENTITMNEQGLIYSIRRNDGWQVVNLDDAGVTGFAPAMAIDGRGNFHIAYHDFQNLFYAMFNGITWSVNQLTSDGGVDGLVGISLDRNGNPGVTFWQHGDLKYMDVTSGTFAGEIVNHYPAGTGDDGGVDEPTTGGGGGGCFIATAAFGTLSADSVSALAAVRDSAFASSDCGSSLVSVYYACSPSVAAELGTSLKALVRSMLD